MDNVRNSPVTPPNKIRKIPWIVGSFIVVLSISALLLEPSIWNKIKSRDQKIADKLTALGTDIASARPIINTDHLPHAQAGKEFQAFIFATVYNVNTKIEGKIVSTLPDGLTFGNCQTEFNSPTVTLSKVSSLVRCGLMGTPKQSGQYIITVHFSVPGSKMTTEEAIPLLINP